MDDPSILTDEFAIAVALAGLDARKKALAAGHPVVFMDDQGRYIQEMPDGRRFEVRFIPGAPRESHMTIVGELKESV